MKTANYAEVFWPLPPPPLGVLCARVPSSRGTVELEAIAATRLSPRKAVANFGREVAKFASREVMV